MFIIGIIIVAALAYLVFRKGDHVNIRSQESPLDLLQKRFVNGEIGEDEYLKIKETLQKR